MKITFTFVRNRLKKEKLKIKRKIFSLIFV